MARDGSVGQATFDGVTMLVEAGATRQQAFEKVAEETGKSPGTVAANYYRVARKQKENGRQPAVTLAPSATVQRSTPRSTPADQLYRCIEQMVDDAVDRRLQRLLG